MHKQLYKLSLSVFIAGLSAQVFASDVTIRNASAGNGSHGPVIVLKDSNSATGIGNIQYLLHSQPVTFKLKSQQLFTAFSSFHTLADGFGHALIASHAVTVGNQTKDGASNFIIQLKGREGKTKIGPLSCSGLPQQQCYEIPNATLKVTVNGKTYPAIQNDGMISLPKGDKYKVDLEVNMQVNELSAAGVKQAASAANKTTSK